jgi:membrane protein
MKKILSEFGAAVRYYSYGVYRRFRTEQLFFYASGIAFNGILCLIPFFLLLTSFLGMLLNSSDRAVHVVKEFLDAAIPDQVYALKMKSVLQALVDDIVRHRSSYGFVGLGILTWTATSLFSSIRAVMNTVYRIKSSKLVILKIVEEVVLVVVVIVLFFAANVIVWFSSFIASWLRQLPGFESIPLGFFKGINAFLAADVPAVVMFFVLNRFIPDQKIGTKASMIAACSTTVLWWVASQVFGWYLSEFRSYSMLYGAYAFLLVFIFWVYYSALVFIVGIIIAQLYRERTIMKEKTP